MSLTHTETERNLLISDMLSKFADLLTLAEGEEVAALDTALAQVMPAQSNSVIQFNVGCKSEETFTQVNLSFVVSPIAEAMETSQVLAKLSLLIHQLNREDLELLYEAIDTLKEANAPKIEIHLSPFPVMEIAPQKWVVHFYLKTL